MDAPLSRASAPTATCFTFGYRFKPWPGPPIATSDEILAYLGDVIEENDLGSPHPLQPRVVVGELVEPTIAWTITAIRTDTGEELTFTASFLWMCQGYYSHAKGYTPEWPGMDTLRGAESCIRRSGRKTSTSRTSASS